MKSFLKNLGVALALIVALLVWIMLPWQGVLVVVLLLGVWLCFTRAGRLALEATRIGIASLPQRWGASSVIIVGIAGSAPTSRPMAAISPRPSDQLFHPIGGRLITPLLTALTIGPISAARPRPSTPPSSTSRIDSASTMPSTEVLVKPIVLSTASSDVRSRTAWAMVLPVNSSKVKNTAPMIEPTIRPMSAICLSCEAIAACSLIVLVSCGEFIDSASMALAAASLRRTSETRLTYQPTSPST